MLPRFFDFFKQSCQHHKGRLDSCLLEGLELRNTERPDAYIPLNGLPHLRYLELARGYFVLDPAEFPILETLWLVSGGTIRPIKDNVFPEMVYRRFRAIENLTYQPVSVEKDLPFIKGSPLIGCDRIRGSPLFTLPETRPTDACALVVHQGSIDPVARSASLIPLHPTGGEFISAPVR